MCVSENHNEDISNSYFFAALLIYEHAISTLSVGMEAVLMSYFIFEKYIYILQNTWVCCLFSWFRHVFFSAQVWCHVRDVMSDSSSPESWQSCRVLSPGRMSKDIK